MKEAKRAEIRGLLERGAFKVISKEISDVHEAYFQSSKLISWDIYAKRPVSEFEFRPDPCFRLLKPLRVENGELKGLSRIYFEDYLPTGSESFRTLERKTNDNYQMEDVKTLPCSFSGLHL
eukprot:IDg19407t1